MIGTILAVIASILAVSLLVVVHEAGHYLAARRFGMRIDRFSIGFGPVLLAFKRGDTEFAISALPLGGYVKIAGMAPGEDADAADRALYSSQTAWRRFLVILAGPGMNYLAAILFAWALLATPLGLRTPDPSARVGALVAGMPADAAGLRPGDRIASVAGTPVGSWLELVQQLQGHPGQEIVLGVVRDGAQVSLPIVPKDDAGVGRVGVQQAYFLARTDPASAIVEGFRRTNANAALQLAAFRSMFSPRQRVEGPAGIVRQLVRGAQEGIEPFLNLVWTISVVLAILNLLPIPALDGGRLAFLTYEIVSRRRVNERVESWLHFAGFVVLVGLILAVTVFGDLPRLLGRK